MINMKGRKISIVTLVMPLFAIALLVILALYDLNPADYVTLTLKRVGMLMIAMLATIPTVYSGIGFNYGVTIGFVCGLGGCVIGISTGLTGLPLMLTCILASIPIALLFGWGYGILLNRVRGAEAMIATYVGFAVISLASIFWISLNVNNEVLRFSNGQGIRVNVALDGLFKDILTDFLPIKIGKLVIPAGFLLVCIVICVLFGVFMLSKTGISMKICGNNPTYASAIGLNVNHYRILSVILSTVIAAVGIAFYAQTFGYYQFYSEYMTLGFSCIAGVLIGGATHRKVGIGHVIYGCLIYEAILTLSTPAVNKLLPGGSLSEIIRLIVTNGVILYALVKGGQAVYGK